ncbi:hypothetical protein FF38_11423 [Lucilia cuprina]|uniref:Uncharacterized protein n=1 Tax=Lucilia cuprina TaxID=7375 RepID=A0A0L0CBC9_LUCCU|nr:hypothetical protein FF38_11423 [Lucilia cuprina]
MTSSWIISMVRGRDADTKWIPKEPKQSDQPGHIPVGNCSIVVPDYLVLWFDPMSNHSKECPSEVTSPVYSQGRLDVLVSSIPRVCNNTQMGSFTKVIFSRGTEAIKTMPTKALFTMLNWLPADLKAVQLTLNSAIRLNACGRNYGHSRIIKQFKSLHLNFDYCITKPNIDNQFTLTAPRGVEKWVVVSLLKELVLDLSTAVVFFRQKYLLLKEQGIGYANMGPWFTLMAPRGVEKWVVVSLLKELVLDLPTAVVFFRQKYLLLKEQGIV